MTDLRILRTKHAIRTAFLELLETQEFKQISVQDIADKAMINRNTFYKHYSGKSALASEMIADFKAEYAAMLQKRLATPNVTEAMQELAQGLFQKRRQLLALWKIDTRRHHLYQDMETMIKQTFIRQANNTFPDKTTDWDYQATLFAVNVLTTARYYFERDLIPPFPQVFHQWREMFAVMGVKI
ncbi:MULTISPECIES: TetR/AcrR family transcriptional regulator [Glaesserella]|uniref:AcrR family transcriptional regulator n=1 Tax=Glaesserella australis TaxID=2094024 RepID=A0A328C0M3_9PAST|nr:MULTISPECIES: TetR/AcrR family transcriptional regulator [Glaesserella]AUI66882.1 AcrR family transcriptional regulator [Glaesserella sp. 15-184]RAL19933.1 AcrR family transcriptional regulator [Glaesserella australis]